jgi:hypothetical protein
MRLLCSLRQHRRRRRLHSQAALHTSHRHITTPHTQGLQQQMLTESWPLRRAVPTSPTQLSPPPPTYTEAHVPQPFSPTHIPSSSPSLALLASFSWPRLPLLHSLLSAARIWAHSFSLSLAVLFFTQSSQLESHHRASVDALAMLKASTPPAQPSIGPSTPAPGAGPGPASGRAGPTDAAATRVVVGNTPSPKANLGPEPDAVLPVQPKTTSERQPLLAKGDKDDNKEEGGCCCCIC